MLDNLMTQVGVVAGMIVLMSLFVILVTIKTLIVLVPPNMAAIITGRKREVEDGGTVGYRAVMGGRTLRIPIIVQVQWLSLSTIPLDQLSAALEQNKSRPIPSGSVWTFNVSPDSAYGEGCGFSFDTFGILTMTSDFAGWRLRVVNLR